MPCRINQLNKKTNVIYVYESASYWDKEKKQARNKKICVGKLDCNGVFIPSGRLKPEQAAVVSGGVKVRLNGDAVSLRLA